MRLFFSQKFTTGAISFTISLLTINLISCDSQTANAILLTPNTQAASTPNTQGASSDSQFQTNPVHVHANYHFTGTTGSHALAQSRTQRNIEYTSASNAFITITVTTVGGSATSYGPTSCTTALCTISFTANPGPTNFNFKLTDNSGNSLSSFSCLEIIQPSILNTFNFTANPIVDSVTLQLASPTIAAGTTATVLLNVLAKDIDGNTIIGNGSYLDANGNPLALLLSTTNNQAGGSGNVSIQGSLRITSPNHAAIYARYDGKWLKQSTISVASTSSVLNSFTSATLATVPAVVNTYTVPTASAGTAALTLGPDGNLWFTEYTTSKIARMTLKGTFTEWSTPTANAKPKEITPGPDGKMWFVEFAGNNIGSITLNGSIIEYPTVTSISFPEWIITGPDGNLWFDENASGANNIAESSTNGLMREFSIPTSSSYPNGIITGPDGNLWFTEWGGGKIGRCTVNGVITEFNIPTANSGPEEITIGPDGNMWFTEYKVGKIGRITTAGTVTEFNIPTAGSGAYGIVQGPDGNIWFSEYSTNKIGYITTAGSITEYTLPTANSGPEDMVFDGNNNLWIIEYNTNAIVQFVY